jgi:sugar lactone lactonase YvrE
MRALAVVFLSVSFVQAQQYIISTYAGAPHPPSLATSIIGYGALTTDTSGNIYFVGTNASCTCVFKLDPNGVVTRVVGSAPRGLYGDSLNGDGGPATSAQLGVPVGLAIDKAGNLFIVDQGIYHFGSYPTGFSADRIRKVSPDGTITTVAGGGALEGSDADGGLATNAQLYYPIGAVLDGAGNLFFAETVDSDGGGSNRIRKVSPDGIIHTVAGNGTFGFSGDGGPAISAQLAAPSSLAIDSGGNLFVADTYNDRIREITLDGTIRTVVDASRPAAQYCGCSVTSVSVDPAGNLFYEENSAVFRWSPDGVISTVVGSDVGLRGWWLASDARSNLLFSTASGLLRISPDGAITPLLGDAACCYSGDGGPARGAQLFHANGVAADGLGNLFIADTGNRRIRQVAPDGNITTVAGNGVWNTNCDAVSGDSSLTTSVQLCSPSYAAVDGAGDLLIVDRNRIRKVSSDGKITSIAGDGTIGTDGDGGPATQAQLAYPNSVAVDAAGNIYFAEWARVRKISPDGIVTTVAGTGSKPATNGCSPAYLPYCSPNYSPGDGRPATQVQLFGPLSVSVDGAGNVYFVDGVRIRKVSLDGTITTVAGNGAPTGYRGPTGDGALATSAPLWTPNGVTVDGAGNLYITEPVRIRKVTTDGVINSIAGTQDPGYSGDGGPATKGQLWNPTGLTVDAAGNVYFADSFNNVVRILRPVQ